MKFSAWATSIKQGTVTASLMLRKPGSYPRQNGLVVTLRELGRIERTLFILDWLQSFDLRGRVHTGLKKGEVRIALWNTDSLIPSNAPPTLYTTMATPSTRRSGSISPRLDGNTSISPATT